MSKIKIFLSKNLNNIVLIFVLIAGIVLDQITKVVLADLLSYNPITDTSKSIKVIGSWLTLYYTINTGASFGLFKGASTMFFIVTIVGVPLLSAWLIFFSKKMSNFGKYGIVCAISGAIGNAIDRLMLGDGFFNGGVRDFISVRGFAIFNVADSFLCVGVGLIVLSMVFFDQDSLIKFKKEKND